MSTTRALCISGWHFREDFFRQVLTIPDADIYVISHRPNKSIPGFLFDVLDPSHILIRPNIGYDWGCYQQFLKSELWKEYEYLYFLHDDVEILDIGFPEVCERLLSKHAVIGNGGGFGSASTASVQKHPYAYAHSSWHPESLNFEHKTVRGSFFATTRKVLEKIGKFEVYWDLFSLNIEFGNWSTKATCGKLQAAFGKDCFGYLSKTFGNSPYLIELYRGNAQETKSGPVGKRKMLYRFLKRVSVVYMEILHRKRQVPFRFLWLFAFKSILAIFSGRI